MAIGALLGQRSAGFSPQIVVTAPTGSTVTASKGGTTLTATEVSGTWTFDVSDYGTWTISATKGSNSASGTVTVEEVKQYTLSLSYFTAYIKVTSPSGATLTLKKGSTTLETKTSTGTDTFTVGETGTYTVSAVQGSNSTSGDVTVTSETTYNLALAFVSTTLNDNSFATIRSVSDAGNGSSYWSVGARKAVTLKGNTIGKQALSGTWYMYILGFNHNSSREGNNKIHFAFGFQNLTGGNDIAFTDSSYNSYATNTDAFLMNKTRTNAGGWSSSYARQTLCANFKNNLPDDLQAVLKTVTKYTDNTGGGSDTASYVTSTTDTIFLLAEFEVFGARSYANSAEKNYQLQYQYYIAGNSKQKYQGLNTGSTAYWWLRSPYASNATIFCLVYTDGNANHDYADYSLGFAPCLCV